jgi:hypothetical protein
MKKKKKNLNCFILLTLLASVSNSFSLAEAGRRWARESGKCSSLPYRAEKEKGEDRKANKQDNILKEDWRVDLCQSLGRSGL